MEGKVIEDWGKSREFRQECNGVKGANDMGQMRTRAAIRSKEAGRAIAGAVVAGLIYDVVKASANRLWARWRQQGATRTI